MSDRKVIKIKKDGCDEVIANVYISVKNIYVEGYYDSTKPRYEQLTILANASQKITSKHRPPAREENEWVFRELQRLISEGALCDNNDDTCSVLKCLQGSLSGSAAFVVGIHNDSDTIAGKDWWKCKGTNKTIRQIESEGKHC